MDLIHRCCLALNGSARLAAGFARRHRRRHGDGPGVRVLALHAEDADDFDRFRRWIEWCGERMPWASPDAFEHGIPQATDALLLTMDDGHARTFRAVEWLATVGIRIVYFVVPSFVGRSLNEYLAYHRNRGVEPFNLAAGRDPDASRGLARSQLAELECMGHRLGAHNDAHRGLAGLSAPDAVYEVDGAIDGLAELVGHQIDDFAWAFGTLRAISPEALALIRRRCRRVYSCVHGLNVPAVTSAVILRDPACVDAPAAFRRAWLQGAFDHRHDRERRELRRLCDTLPAYGSAAAGCPLS